MIAFIDFEASSLSAYSYPIEVGWCSEDGQVQAHLIRPADTWHEWSASSETVHGISRGLLRRDGRAAAEVAHDVMRALAPEKALVFADAPAWDQEWLNLLLAQAGLPRSIVILDAQQAYGYACRPLLNLVPEWHPRRDERRQEIARQAARLVAEATEAEALRRRVRHRAGPDAEGLWWTWREVQQRVTAEIGAD